MSYCDGLINAGLTGSACVPMKKGFERAAVIVNRSDIDFSAITRASGNSNVLTALPLKSGKKGYLVNQLGGKPFTGSTVEGVVGTYSNTVTKKVVIAIPNNEKTISEQFTDGLLNGEFVVILEKKDKGADNASAFVVIGLDNGAVLNAYSEDAYGDTAGGALVTLQEEGASNVAVYLGESYTAGKTIFDSLVSAK